MKKKVYALKDLEKIIALGKQKGFLTYDEVNDLLPEEMSSSGDMDHLFELLGNEDIQVVEHEEEIIRAADEIIDEALKGFEV